MFYDFFGFVVPLPFMLFSRSKHQLLQTSSGKAMVGIKGDSGKEVMCSVLVMCSEFITVK